MPRSLDTADVSVLGNTAKQYVTGLEDETISLGIKYDPTIDALLDVWPIFEAFQLTYVSKGLLLEQEKNVSALLPNGPSAGASDTAKPAHPTRAASKPARTARRG